MSETRITVAVVVKQPDFTNTDAFIDWLDDHLGLCGIEVLDLGVVSDGITYDETATVHVLGSHHNNGEYQEIENFWFPKQDTVPVSEPGAARYWWDEFMNSWACDHEADEADCPACNPTLTAC
jgi:hypothetical protein